MVTNSQGRHVDKLTLTNVKVPFAKVTRYLDSTIEKSPFITIVGGPPRPVYSPQFSILLALHVVTSIDLTSNGTIPFRVTGDGMLGGGFNPLKKY